MKTIRDEIVKQLQEVYDPEISINVFDLGLIYDIQINEEERSVEITHTLTSAFCGFADVIAEDIRKAGYVDGIDNVSIVTTFDPPFTLDMVPEETKLAMGW
jgi:metal-sulfur cluster biosynthetic enzyme|tara:strand:+ start:650 stop:952 length:303 start_codon:yes stop_codon:yes gene_type:complete